MTATHKGKSIKDLVNSRISGTIYRRQPTSSLNSKPTLQDIAESIMTEREHSDEVEQLFMNKSERKIHTPTILQTMIAKEEVGIFSTTINKPKIKQIQAKAKQDATGSGFSWVPKILQNY